MYSGLYFKHGILNTKIGNTHCFMIWGISKVHTLLASYEFVQGQKLLDIISELTTE